jgi:hypothetical protein
LKALIPGGVQLLEALPIKGIIRHRWGFHGKTTKND